MSSDTHSCTLVCLKVCAVNHHRSWTSASGFHCTWSRFFTVRLRYARPIYYSAHPVCPTSQHLMNYLNSVSIYNSRSGRSVRPPPQELISLSTQKHIKTSLEISAVSQGCMFRCWAVAPSAGVSECTSCTVNSLLLSMGLSSRHMLQHLVCDRLSSPCPAQTDMSVKGLLRITPPNLTCPDGLFSWVRLNPHQPVLVRPAITKRSNSS
jgi:hypothetical protein